MTIFPKRDWTPGWLFVPLCLLLGMLLRLEWALAYAPQPTSDFAWYVARGLALAHGQGYTINGIPTAYFPPGYPAFLALLFRLFGDSLLVARLGNVALQTASLFLLYRLARRLFQSEATARVALLLAALYPNGIAGTGLPGSEYLFIVLMLLGTLLLLQAEQRWPLWLAAGCVLGCATLTRPQGLLIPAVFFLWTLTRAWRARRVDRWLGQALLVAAALAATLAPWLLRNARVMGTPALTTTGGINLYLGNSAEADGNYRTTPWFAAMTAAETSEHREDLRSRQQALAELRADPWRMLRLVPRKFNQLYAKDTDNAQYTRLLTPNLAGARVGIARRVERLSQWYYRALWLLAGLALLRRPRSPALGLLMLAAFTLVHLVFYGMPRYHAPMMPWVILYAGAALTISTRRDEGQTNHGDSESTENMTLAK